MCDGDPIRSYLVSRTSRDACRFGIASPSAASTLAPPMAPTSRGSANKSWSGPGAPLAWPRSSANPIFLTPDCRGAATSRIPPQGHSTPFRRDRRHADLQNTRGRSRAYAVTGRHLHGPRQVEDADPNAWTPCHIHKRRRPQEDDTGPMRRASDVPLRALRQDGAAPIHLDDVRQEPLTVRPRDA